MIQKIPIPEREYLLACLDYDPDTGSLKWATRPLSHFKTERGWRQWNARYPGIEAGCKRSNVVYVRLNKGPMYVAHRLCWVMAGRDLPDNDMHIDHINGDPTDNRLCNLRIATHAQNCRNRGPMKRNTSGFKGVSFHKPSGKWRADIGKDGSSRFLGLFDMPENAALAYEAASKELHGEFARTTTPTK